LLALLSFFVGRLVITDRLHGWWLVAAAIWAVWWLLPKSDTPGEPRGWRLVWLAVGLALLVVGRNALTTPQFQGRFLFPAIGPLSLLAVAGWHALLPGRARQAILPAALLILLATHLILISRILAVYYQPWLD
jgi:hypothetical protein